MKINIDAGHGTNTAGKRTPPMPKDIIIDGKVICKKGEQFREHIANVGVAFLLEQELKRCGFETFRTGWDDDNAYDDPDQGLADRQRAIAKANCDYSISIHFNAFGDGKTFNTAEGVGIYIHNRYQGQSKKLAEIVLKHLAGGTKQKDRGVTPYGYAMVNCNNMDVKGAILVELAFMTNLREATELMVVEEFWKECALEIAKGLCEYTGIKYIPEQTHPERVTVYSPKEDIRWLQRGLNQILPEWFPKISEHGIYDDWTRFAVLALWIENGWGKHMNDDGKTAGRSTCKDIYKRISK
ncbi:N-acetylmuramoyl-L-alanine amidase [Mobilitalea sibirica]|uniref:N-acetylmuramoyl-L-alanine amidase n=1 Tax=Mobilitalea sibirica TaxID=1462919 RepID=A0A8J7H3G9_9FIRM|nr:N-acetylmuramoyl-L-alanine amidase [Mobilitalea sibirica]MBH1941627.1 N-acetylmuramoyl-L-alanine amidase [Mobilitalea sibirica]